MVNVHKVKPKRNQYQDILQFVVSNFWNFLISFNYREYLTKVYCYHIFAAFSGELDKSPECKIHICMDVVCPVHTLDMDSIPIFELGYSCGMTLSICSDWYTIRIFLNTPFSAQAFDESLVVNVDAVRPSTITVLKGDL